MIKAYEEGKDLYALIGSKSFKVPYEQCLEFNPVTKELQPAGKARRSKAKAILLGITYGMSAKSLADRLECTLEEAEDIINSFYDGFPGVKQLTLDSQKMLKEKGYVEDMWGRRRHIPDAQLPEYDIKPVSGAINSEFNPLIGAVPHEDKALQLKIEKYRSQLSKATWKKDKDKIINQAKLEGLSVKNNQGFINRALRQCLNARIQGTASSMTKQAMIMLHNDPILKELGFELLVTVHDEVFGQAPAKNAKAASKRLSELMVAAAKLKCVCPFKCDGYEVAAWYADENVAGIKDKYDDLIKSGKSHDEAVLSLSKKFSFFSVESIEAICNGTFRLNKDSIKYGLNYF